VIEAIGDERTRSVHVAWFGGEPLTAFPTVLEMSRRFVDVASESGVLYTSMMTTNGSLLDENKLALLTATCKVSRFDITLDGPARVHDVHRPLKNGRPNFDRLVHFLAESLSNLEYKDVRFVLRTNVDIANADFVIEYLELMADLGFGRFPQVIFQLSPIHSWGNDVSGIALPIERVARDEIVWFEKALALGLSLRLLPTEAVTNTCTATHGGSEVIAATGEIYGCTEEPLVPTLGPSPVISTVNSLGLRALRPKSKYDEWPSQVNNSEYPCSNCSLLPVCGGNCPKRWYEGEVACPTMKSNMPARLSLWARHKGLKQINA
jgi:uncharacterized protein